MTVMRALPNESDSPEYIAEGYATTFDEPYLLYEFDNEKLYEVVAHDALEGCDMSDVIMQFDHEGRVYARTHNETLKLTVDEKGLRVWADLSRTESARRLWEEIHEGMIERMSFCFTVDELDYDDETKTQTIVRIGKLYDVSAVSIPANPMTDISARSRAVVDGVIEQRKAERLEAEKRKEKKKRDMDILRLKIKIARMM